MSGRTKVEREDLRMRGRTQGWDWDSRARREILAEIGTPGLEGDSRVREYSRVRGSSKLRRDLWFSGGCHDEGSDSRVVGLKSERGLENSQIVTQ